MKDEAVADSIIEAASRAIDGLTGRHFYVTESEARYFTPEDPYCLDVDDLVSVTSLVVDEDGDRTYERTWATTDYDLEPYNAALKGMPYTKILTAPNGNYDFVRTRKGVKITGTWGWPSVPDAIAEATLLQATRLFQRKLAPFGISGSADLGQVTFLPKVDQDVRTLIAPYQRLWVGAV